MVSRIVRFTSYRYTSNYTDHRERVSSIISVVW